jgi:putative transposase
LLPHDKVRISDILYQLKKPVTTWSLKWVKRNRPSFLTRMQDVQPGGKICCRFWQRGGGYDRNLRSTRDIHEKIRYIHENPVRRGLVNLPRDWPWSSCRAWEEGVDEPIRLDVSTVPVLENV